MKLTNLFKKQAELDAHIVEKHNLQGQNLLQKKVLALTVELSELANEIPAEWKFWSNKPNNTEKALVEYVDALHFALSIGNEWGMEEKEFTPYSNITMQDTFHDMIYEILGFLRDDNAGNYIRFMREFLAMPKLLGFTWEQVESAYFAKHEVNYQRQQEGY
jgi:dimeric dUTPase (all-alpha-NTP-PPase superfamily)